MHIKKNEDLFNQWKSLSRSVAHQSGIVQNDCEISSENLDAWKRVNHTIRAHIKELEALTLQHCEGLQPLRIHYCTCGCELILDHTLRIYKCSICGASYKELNSDA